MEQTVIDRVLERARFKGMNQSAFARVLGVEPQHVTNWKRRGLPAEMLVKVARALDASVEQVLGDQPFDPLPGFMLRYAVTKQADPDAQEDAPEYAGPARAYRRVPVVGTAKMGDDGFYEEMSSMQGAGDGHIEIATEDPNAYCLRVRGQSMFPAIRDGWYVLIEPSGTPREGEYVLLKLADGRKMVKEFLFRRQAAVEVMSVNGGTRITFDNADVEAMQPVGAVVSPSKWRPE